MRCSTTSWLLCTLLLFAQDVIQAQELTADRLYDWSQVHEISIDIDPVEWKQLCNQTRDPGKVFAGKIEDPFTYFKADITLDGQAVKSVGLRKKGFIGSLDNHFPSLKVKFDEYIDQAPVEQLEGLTLNNNKQDAPLLSQFMAYKIFREAGVKASRVSFARVTVNGEYLGIYSNVESISKSFLKNNFGDEHGNLYEGTLADFHPKAIDRIEIKTNKKKHDLGKVRRLAELLATKDLVDRESVANLVDIDNFLRYWAVESLIGFWDGYTNNQNNFWFYENPTNGKFYFLPWGADAAFMSGGFPGFGPAGPLSVYSQSMLANKLYHHDEIAERYKETMQRILADIWDEDELIKTIDQLESLLKPHLHARQMGAPRAMGSMRSFIKRRQKLMEGELESWPARSDDQPRKPMYVVLVGQAQGKFVADWSDRPPKDPSAAGQLELKLELDNATVQLSKAGAAVHPPSSGGFPGFPGPFQPVVPMAHVVFTVQRENDQRPLRLTLPIPVEDLKNSAGKTVALDGTCSEEQAQGGFFPPFNARTLTGSVTFTKVGFKPDESIEGDFDLRIQQVHGGFFDRGNR